MVSFMKATQTKRGGEMSYSRVFVWEALGISLCASKVIWEADVLLHPTNVRKYVNKKCMHCECACVCVCREHTHTQVFSVSS